jgi:hypothetical protein
MMHPSEPSLHVIREFLAAALPGRIFGLVHVDATIRARGLVVIHEDVFLAGVGTFHQGVVAFEAVVAAFLREESFFAAAGPELVEVETHLLSLGGRMRMRGGGENGKCAI